MLGLKAWLLAVGLLAALSVSAVVAALPVESDHPAIVASLPDGTRPLTIGNHQQLYGVFFAQTDAARTKGLGDRASLPAGEGMLFFYGQPHTLCFWMKDMHFSIDMLWLSANKRITFVQPNVSPATFPENFCHDGMYVLELNAGEAARKGLTPGQQVTF